MKKLFVFLVFLFAAVAFAQGVPVATPTPTAAAVATPGMFSAIWAFLWGPGGACMFAAMYAISEMLANFFPNLKANSFFQLVVNGLRKAEAKNPMPPAAT